MTSHRESIHVDTDEDEDPIPIPFVLMAGGALLFVAGRIAINMLISAVVPGVLLLRGSWDRLFLKA